MIEPETQAKRDKTIKGFLFGQLPLEAETSMFILVNVLDFFMTYWLLTSGNFKEANPVANYFLMHWGPVRGMLYFKLSLVVVVSVLAQLIALKDVRKAEFVLKFGTVVVSAVVVYGVVIYLKQL